jgi:hypothetical protein
MLIKSGSKASRADVTLRSDEAPSAVSTSFIGTVTGRAPDPRLDCSGWHTQTHDVA